MSQQLASSSNYGNAVPLAEVPIVFGVIASIELGSSASSSSFSVAAVVAVNK